mgnify:CR=1 FL=1
MAAAHYRRCVQQLESLKAASYVQRSGDEGNREIFLFRFEAPNCL